jgi:hypothetical protein
MSVWSASEVLISSQIDGPTLTAAAAATCLPAASKKTMPANFLANLGQVLLIKATGRISSVITTPGTARFDIRFGGTVIFDGLAVLLETAAGYTNVRWDLEIMLTVRAIGTSANMWGQGTFAADNLLGVPATAPKPALVATLPWNSAPAVGANFSSIVSQEIDMFFTQTVATGSLTVHQFMVWAP